MIRLSVRNILILLGGLAMIFGTLWLAGKILITQFMAFHIFSFASDVRMANIDRFNELLWQPNIIFSFILTIAVIVTGAVLVYNNVRQGKGEESQSIDEPQ